MEGLPVDLKPLITQLEPRAVITDIELVLPVGHPRIGASASASHLPEILPALWVQNLEEPQAEALHAHARLVRGLLVQQDEAVVSAGSDIDASPGPKYLQRLPRILFEDHALIADNTDAAVSMGRLLEDFVQRFSTLGTEFDRLPAAAYRRVSDQVFVRRTRSGLIRRYGTVPDYPVKPMRHAYAKAATDVAPREHGLRPSSTHPRSGSPQPRREAEEHCGPHA